MSTRPYKNGFWPELVFNQIHVSDERADEDDEAFVDGGLAVATDAVAAVLLGPGDRPLHWSAALAASELRGLAPLRDNGLDAAGA